MSGPHEMTLQHDGETIVVCFETSGTGQAGDPVIPTILQAWRKTDEVEINLSDDNKDMLCADIVLNFTPGAIR